MEEVAEVVNQHAKEAKQPAKSVDEVAMGFIRVANETMCRPIRALTQMRVSRLCLQADHNMLAFEWTCEVDMDILTQAGCCCCMLLCQSSCTICSFSTPSPRLTAACTASAACPRPESCIP
jgi:Hydantoinase/oxoprolinase